MIAKDQAAAPAPSLIAAPGGSPRPAPGAEPSGMLGQAIGPLCSGAAQKWFQGWYGVADLHARQKWNILWPHLASLPSQGLTVLDAGCGDGIWSFELAARRPGWRVQGIDLDASKIAIAERNRTRLGSPNTSFAVADFMEFEPAAKVDAILSVASAHYLAQIGRGPELLQRFSNWLKPGGVLVLYGPRELSQSPVAAWLPKLSGDWGFTREQLAAWADEAGLDVIALNPAVGRLGTLAKQLAIFAGPSAPLRALCYPATMALDWLDRRGAAHSGRASSAWSMVAARRQPGARREAAR